MVTLRAAGRKEPSRETVVQRLRWLQETISPSRLSLWLQCRLKLYFKYVEQIAKPTSPFMCAGLVVHAVMESWNRSRYQGEVFDLERLRTCFSEQWLAVQQDRVIRWNGDEPRHRLSSWRVLELYHRQTPIPPDEKPVAIEMSVEADLSSHGLPRLIGVLDLVRAGERILDFKLVSRLPDPVMLVHQHELQLTCYSVLFRDHMGRNEAGLELHHLVRTTTPSLTVTVLPPATELQRNRLFRQMESYQEGIQREDFIPSPGFHCASCEFFHECRSWR